jgi:ankyrin repeat protein
MVSVGMMRDCCGLCVQNGRTPLHEASLKGHAAVVELLLEVKGGELAKAEDEVRVVGGACV